MVNDLFIGQFNNENRYKLCIYFNESDHKIQ